MGQTSQDQPQVRRVGRPSNADIAQREAQAKAQEYAQRVWDGATGLPSDAHRRAWVRQALEGQNLPVDGVVIGGAGL